MSTSLPVIRLLHAILLFLSTVAAPQLTAGQLAPTSHCTREESVHYNCVVEGSRKVASVCGVALSKADGVERTYLQYRFGLIGETEFVFPADFHTATKNFHFERQSTQDGSTQDYFLWFRNDEWIYQIYYREEFEICTETGCSDERTGQAAFVSAWRGFEAWRNGDESNGRSFKCTNPKGNEAFKSLGEQGLYNREIKEAIFGGGDG